MLQILILLSLSMNRYVSDLWLGFNGYSFQMKKRWLVWIVTLKSWQNKYILWKIRFCRQYVIRVFRWSEGTRTIPSWSISRGRYWWSKADNKRSIWSNCWNQRESRSFWGIGSSHLQVSEWGGDDRKEHFKTGFSETESDRESECFSSSSNVFYCHLFSLHRFISSLDAAEGLKDTRQYIKAARSMGAVMQLSRYFDKYKDIETV